jgi:hypothetical protein
MLTRLVGIFVFALAICFSHAVEAQNNKYKPKYNTSRKVKKEPFPSTKDYKQGGWLGGAGLTAMVGFGDNEVEFPQQDLEGTFTPIPLPGLMLEGGRYYNLKKGWIIKYLDASLAYKLLLGREEFSITSPTQNVVYEDNHSFNQHFASVNLNANSIIPIDDYSFIQSAFGVNADIRFVDGYPSNYPDGITGKNDNGFVGQIHYKLGYGYALDTDLIIETSLETPIYTFAPSGSHFSQLDYYNQQYQPFILRVRLLFFRLDNDKCPPVINHQLPGGFQNGYGD